MKRIASQHIIVYKALLYIFACALWSCANRGVGPQGGPKDETPPVIIKETPLNGTTDFHETLITLQFDEYVQLNDVANEVLISPPQQKAPIVKAVGKKITVSFEEGLSDSTTYAIDFGKAICDNNERNPMQNYVFSFSTGPVIDTLEVSGVLIDAETLNPVSGVYVGLHSDLSDTAIVSFPFRNIARTNDEGEFRIQNIHPGAYHLFALNDVSKDYLYQPGEGLAFLDTVFVPVAIDSLVVDSLPHDTIPTDSLSLVVSQDSLAIDTLMPDTLVAGPRHVTRYEPSGIILRYFTENKQRHYFQRCIREEQHFFKLLFGAPQDTLPKIQWNYSDSLPAIDSTAFIMQGSGNLDTVTVWITDSAYIQQDTLSFLMTYIMSDSVYNLVEQTDTLTAVYRAPRMSEKTKEALDRKKKNRLLELKSNASNSFDIYNLLQLRFSTPVRSCIKDSMHLYHVQDTLKTAIPFTLEKADSSAMVWAVGYDWKAEESYMLVLDSAAFTDVYDISNLRQEVKLKVRSLEEYSTLTLLVEPFDSTMMIQILSEKDEPLRTMRAVAAGAKFEYLKPASYYVRVYQDQNGDSIWTTGDYSRHLQPEPMYYFPQKLTLRANWEFEETVHYLEKNALEQKPQEIRKAIGSKKK